MQTTSKHWQLIVIRISDSSAVKELANKVVETADLYPRVPGARRLKQLGATPLTNPDLVDGQAHTGPGFRAVLFRLPGTRTHVLMALGSATKTNVGDDDNAFVTLLSSTLKSTKYESLWVADFARLLRSVDYLSDTWKAVRGRCRYVRHSTAVIDTASPTAEIQFLFEALTAAADARSTVRRTLRGKMRAFLNGQCPLSEDSLPLGYALDERRIVLDGNVPVEVVQAVIRALGDPSLTNDDRVLKVRQAAERHATTPAQRRRCKQLLRAQRAGGTVSRWYDMLDAWRSGRWTIHYAIPTLLDNDHFETVDILDDGDSRTWRMAFDLPLPEHGWATDDEFDAALELRDQRNSRNRPSGAGRRKPFCGMGTWKADGWEYTLMSNMSGLYELRRRPNELAQERRKVGGQAKWVARGWGRRPNLEGELVARISAPHLHQVVTRGLVEAACEGLQLRRTATALLDVENESTHELRAQLKIVRRRAANAQRNANDAETEAMRQDYLREHHAAAAEAEALEQDLLRAAPLGGGTVAVDADAVATVLAAVADVDDHVPAHVADALGRAVTGLRIIPIDHETARWEALLHVPIGGGTLALGPAVGQLQLGTSRQLARIRMDSLSSRAGEATALLMADDLDVDEVARHLDIKTTRRVAQAIRDHLKQLGLEGESASHLVAAGTSTARLVVWHRLRDLPYPRGVDPRLARHLASIYLRGDVSPLRHRRGLTDRVGHAIDIIAASGGWVPEAEFDELCAAAGISRTTLGVYLNGRQRGTRWRPPVLAARDGGAGLLLCPHEGCAGWATIASVHPEVSTLVLCSACLRMPDDNTQFSFTREYR